MTFDGYASGVGSDENGEGGNSGKSVGWRISTGLVYVVIYSGETFLSN
jgi:hypothetical protein